MADRAPRSTARPMLLLVEDDDVLAELLQGLLAPLAEVVWKENAEDALAVLDRHGWDLIISDINLPGMDGLELVKRVKPEHPHTAFLMLSGYSDFEHAVAAIRAGADDYLAKPVDTQALVAKARELIAHSQARRSASREVVLAIGAHPDDVEIGVGGILLRHAAEGNDVNVLTLSGGEAGGEPGARAKESARAAELMSARLFHADLPDTSMSVSDGGIIIGTIAQVIDEIRPTTVYTHTIRDVHQDHRNVNRATLVAARGIPHVFCYQAPSTNVEYHPTRFVSIDDYIDGKLEVVEAYATQATTRGYLAPDLLRATARYWSRFTLGLYVEPLEIVRDSDVQGGVHKQPTDSEDAPLEP